MRTYRHYLRALGRKPIDADKLRTAKEHGSVEIVHDWRDRTWRRHEYEHPLLRD